MFIKKDGPCLPEHIFYSLFTVGVVSSQSVSLTKPSDSCVSRMCTTHVLSMGVIFLTWSQATLHSTPILFHPTFDVSMKPATEGAALTKDCIVQCGKTWPCIETRLWPIQSAASHLSACLIRLEVQSAGAELDSYDLMGHGPCTAWDLLPLCPFIIGF